MAPPEQAWCGKGYAGKDECQEGKLTEANQSSRRAKVSRSAPAAFLRSDSAPSLPRFWWIEQGPNGFTKQWKNAQGYKIFSYFWPTSVAKPKGVLLLLHGHNVNVPFEFLKSAGVGKERVYSGSWIEELNKQGYSCCGIDVQSKGRSEGYKGYKSFFNSFDDVVADDLAFVEKLPELGGPAFGPGLPIFPFGVSMGGARGTMLLLENESLFKAALFYAPMLSLERISNQGANRYLKPLIDFFNLATPAWRLAAPAISKFPDLQEEFENDFFSDEGDLVSVFLPLNSRLVADHGRFFLLVLLGVSLQVTQESDSRASTSE